MIDPWTLGQRFIDNMQQQAATSQATADNVLLRMIASNIGRQDAATQQGYGMDTLAKRNEYATQADTVAYERQLARDETAYKREGEAAAQRRRYQVADNETEFSQRRQLQREEQEMIAAREAAERGDVPGRARRFGPLSSYEQGTISRESGGNASAKNPNSSATGIAQFTAGTWAGLMKKYPELGLTANGRTDPAQSLRAFRAFTRDNENVLRQNGIEPTDGNKYAAHFLGAGGAVAALRRPDNTPMSAVVGQDVLAANPFLGRMTVGQFKQWTASKYAGSSVDTAAPRRYGDGQSDPSYAAGVFNQPVSNSGGDMPLPNETAPISPWLQSYLDNNKLEAVDRVAMTEAQMSLLPPELVKEFIPDIADTSQQGVKGAKTEYIRVRPRTMPEASGLPTPGPKQTKADPIQVDGRPIPGLQ